MCHKFILVVTGEHIKCLTTPPDSGVLKLFDGTRGTSLMVKCVLLKLGSFNSVMVLGLTLQFVHGHDKPITMQKACRQVQNPWFDFNVF